MGRKHWEKKKLLVTSTFSFSHSVFKDLYCRHVKTRACLVFSVKGTERVYFVFQETLTFPYNLENVIDDWVLMGFLVGNDFIPHLPNLHINHDALPLLWKTYVEVLPSCGGKSFSFQHFTK